MKLTVRVSEDNIRDGLPLNAFHCPDALALNDLGLDVAVTHNTVMCYEGGAVLWTVSLPVEEQHRIEDYDCNRFMEPHEFELEVPECE